MNETGQFICKNFFRLIQLASLPGIHLVDLLKRQECQHTDTFQYVCIADISPILVEIKRGRFIRIQPYRSGLCLAHLLSLGVEKQCDRHRTCVFSEFAADQFRSCQHIAPLIVSSELQITSVILVQCIEIVRLHDHVVKLEEA